MLNVTIIIAAFVIFYATLKVNDKGLAGVEVTSPFTLLMNMITSASLKTQVNIIAGSLIHLMILYFPLFVGILLFFQKNNSISAIPEFDVSHFVVLTIALSIAVWAILYLELNSTQVFSNSAIVLLNLYIAACLISIYKKRQFRGGIAFMALVLIISSLCLQIVQTFEARNTQTLHSQQYLNEIYQIVKADTLVRGVCIKDAGILQDVFSKYNAVYPLGDYLTTMNDDIRVINIGDFNTPIDSSSVMNTYRSLKAMENGLFYKIVTRHNQLPVPDSIIEESQIDFIDHFNVQFAILSANTELPGYLKHRIDKFIEDDFTKEKFIVLKASKRN
jgi:hypothetical protein